VKVNEAVALPVHATTAMISARTAMVAVVLLVAGALLSWWLVGPQRLVGGSPAPSVAVMRFENLGRDPDDYFANGLTEDLITDLAILPGVFIVARNSTSGFGERPAAVEKVARELGVSYVVVGSVRREGDRVRVNTLLIDAATGHHLWAKRYSGSTNDVFALQDRIIENIVSALTAKLTVGPLNEKSQPAGSSQQSLAVHTARPNQPPTAVVLENAVTSVSAKAISASRIHVADLRVIDDGLGSNVFSLSGQDANVFDVIGGVLYLKAHVPLDLASKSYYNVTVNVDDSTVGTTPDASSTFRLGLTD
jgi:TolB-like protein